MFTWGGCLNSWCNFRRVQWVWRGRARLLRLRGGREVHQTPEWHHPGVATSSTRHICQHKLPQLRQEATWGSAHCCAHRALDWLEQAERSNPHSADSQSWLADFLPVIILPGKESHGSSHSDSSWLISSKMLSRYGIAVASGWTGSRSKSPDNI